MDKGRHTARGRRVLVWGALAVLLCIVVIAVPDAWIEPITRLLGPDPAAPSAFSDAATRLDDELARGEASLDRQTALRLVPQVAARRLTRAGPLTENDVSHAAELWATAMRSAFDEPSDGSPDAHYAVAERRIIETFGRLDAERVSEELSRLRGQTDAALQPPGGSWSDDCGTCHRQTQQLAGERRFDVAGIYPLIGDDPSFAGGRRVPILAESIELGDRDDCQTCHLPHGTRGFGLTHAERVDNMGLWVKTFDTDPSIVHVEVKVKNEDSGHRAPAGATSPAYVVTVEARQRSERLPLRAGPELPAHLRRGDRKVGVTFARHFVDASGRVTTDRDAIADLRGDSRLESGRFAQKDFVFDRAGRDEVSLEIVLWYLPDYATWKGARAVRRVDSTERAELAR